MLNEIDDLLGAIGTAEPSIARRGREGDLSTSPTLQMSASRQRGEPGRSVRITSRTYKKSTELQRSP